MIRLRSTLFCIFLLSFILPVTVQAQMYGSARVGISTISVEGTVQDRSVQWGGATFLASGALGYELYSSTAGSFEYHLEVEAAVNYSSFNFIRAAQANRYSSDYFTRNGFDGGNSVITAFEVRPVHRFMIHRDDWYSPFVSVGVFGVVYSTSDLRQRGASTAIRGTKATFAGADLSYGVVIEALDIIKPYVMLNHYLLVGPEFSPLEGMTASSRPSTFAASVGIRFEL